MRSRLVAGFGQHDSIETQQFAESNAARSSLATPALNETVTSDS